MIELIMKNYLEDNLRITVLLEKPDDPIDKYIVIDKTGSGEVNHLPEATLAFQSYAKSKYEAALLNKSVKSAIKSSVDELHEIRGITLNGDYPFPDVQSKKQRYQAVYDIRYY